MAGFENGIHCRDVVVMGKREVEVETAIKKKKKKIRSGNFSRALQSQRQVNLAARKNSGYYQPAVAKHRLPSSVYKLSLLSAERRNILLRNTTTAKVSLCRRLLGLAFPSCERPNLKYF